MSHGGDQARKGDVAWAGLTVSKRRGSPVASTRPQGGVLRGAEQRQWGGAADPAGSKAATRQRAAHIQPTPGTEGL